MLVNLFRLVAIPSYALKGAVRIVCGIGLSRIILLIYFTKRTFNPLI